ncbi:DUF2919 family protein [Cronobacter sakazakii]|nr:DUF2919 family protein [Cronobacter sakazakii]ELY5804985.1 DUF2919 family protein [Cronobacter sakazakii]ELY5855543.1 DUF2919 family protein [Cronobacter malonaticus]HAY0261774.1 DUF2919 domain-containing protein [Escherichia coli]
MRSRYDMDGRLKLPSVCWLSMIFLLKSWVLLSLTLAAGKDTVDIASLFYPDVKSLISDLICGIPVIVFCFFYPVRDRYALVMGVIYTLLLICVIFSLGIHLINLLYGGVFISWIQYFYGLICIVWGGIALVIFFPSKKLIKTIQGK